MTRPPGRDAHVNFAPPPPHRPRQHPSQLPSQLLTSGPGQRKLQHTGTSGRFWNEWAVGERVGGWDWLCQPIRLMLGYTGTEFEEKNYPVGDAPDYDKSEWLAVKFKLGLAFPNLPYYIDGDVKITQSKAIMRYLARKHGLCGTTPEELVRTDMLECQLTDMHEAFFTVTYEHYEQKDAYTASLPAKLRQYSDFLGSRPWFAGDKLTYIDFLAYEIFDQHLSLDRTCLDGFKNLRAFQKRFEDLEAIRKYMASPKFLKKPICNKYAQFTIIEGK